MQDFNVKQTENNLFCFYQICFEYYNSENRNHVNEKIIIASGCTHLTVMPI